MTKRLYRFLDKRFFHRARWEFHLQELCWEHVGLARSTTSPISSKSCGRRLRNWSGHRFIQEVPEAERFLKASSGNGGSFFDRAGKGATKNSRSDVVNEPLCQALVDRGVTRSTAVETVWEVPTRQVQRQLEVLTG